MSRPRQLCTFEVDELYLGVDVCKVQEVIRYQPITRVPLSSAVVRGLINLRGQIVTAIDLRRRLGLPDLPSGQLPMNVVVCTEEGPMSLLVDEIGDVVEIAEDFFEHPPQTVNNNVRDLIQGAYKLKNRLLLTLDADRAVMVAQ